MLADEVGYTESRWQEEISSMLRLIYPKYVSIHREPPILDSNSSTKRRVDFLLVDSSGNIDIAEIKKPFDQCVVSKNVYRDNHIPMKELSGSIMQVEKYIYHLNRSGEKGEKELEKHCNRDLSHQVKIHITNPNAIIIVGRSKGMTESQKMDFEIIRRKYKNLMDILTYDDLLERLDTMVKHWSYQT